MNHQAETIYEALEVSEEKYNQLNDYLSVLLTADASIPDRKTLILEQLFVACNNESEKLLATYMFSRWFQWFADNRDEADKHLDSNKFIL